MFELSFKTDNEVFTGNDHEVRRILAAVSARILNGDNNGAVRDFNGNVVGTWIYDPHYNGEEESEDGTDGQDRESYSDNQDRENYTCEQESDE